MSPQKLTILSTRTEFKKHNCANLQKLLQNQDPQTDDMTYSYTRLKECWKDRQSITYPTKQLHYFRQQRAVDKSRKVVYSAQICLTYEMRVCIIFCSITKTRDTSGCLVKDKCFWNECELFEAFWSSVSLSARKKTKTNWSIAARYMKKSESFVRKWVQCKGITVHNVDDLKKKVILSSCGRKLLFRQWTEYFIWRATFVQNYQEQFSASWITSVRW